MIPKTRNYISLDCSKCEWWREFFDFKKGVWTGYRFCTYDLPNIKNGKCKNIKMKKEQK
jgi:hypothetical protein